MSVFGVRRPLAVTEGLVVMSQALRSPLEFWRSLRMAIFDPYRPELHYMRGPGPKCRAKRAGTSGG
jgi:hypothetical protein